MGGAEFALVADIGGTNARFALARRDADAGLVPGSVAQYAVAHFATIADAMRHYLVDGPGAGIEAPGRAVLAVAGPIEGVEVRITNSPWVISAADLCSVFGFAQLRLINDFAAMSAAIPRMGAGALHAIGPLPPPLIDFAIPGVFGVMGPGTGLGVGVLVVNGGQALILETEGGHASFAPVTGEQVAIRQLLAARFGRVSIERLLSGSGLLNIHEALCALKGRTAAIDTPEEVTAAASASADAEAVHAVELFIEMLGDVAGDVVLTTGAWDGLFLSGGLVQPLLPWLERGAFRRHFESKGRRASTLARVPVMAVLHDHPGLVGAAVMALDPRVDTVRATAGADR